MSAEEARGALAPLHEKGARFAIDSERFLGFAEHLPEAARRPLAVLCDKSVFRSTLQQAGNAPAVSSRTYGRDDLLDKLSWEELLRQVGTAPDGIVIKPVRGFQSDLVSICRNAEDWERARTRIRNPPQGVSPVTDASTFVVETYVQGDELAIDVYFDEEGAPVVTGIYLHPFRDELDARDIVYRTSARVKLVVALSMRPSECLWRGSVEPRPPSRALG